LKLGLALSAVAVLMRLGAGAQVVNRSLGRSHSLAILITVYLLGSLACALVEALLEPLRRTLLGSIVTSVGSLIPFGTLMILAFVPPPIDPLIGGVSVVGIAVVLGGPLGYREWRWRQLFDEASKPLP